jgi:hypothetical protein
MYSADTSTGDSRAYRITGGGGGTGTILDFTSHGVKYNVIRQVGWSKRKITFINYQLRGKPRSAEH